jgi:hypothetical protein
MTDKPLSLGELIDDAYLMREKRKGLDAVSKEIGKEIEETKALIREKMAELGVSAVKGTLSSASMTQSTVPIVEDFEETLKWVKEDFDNRKHLLQRRVASKAWQEMMKLEGEIPGITPFVKRDVGLRKLEQ